MKDILVVEDEKPFRDNLAEYLGIHYGVGSVVTTGNGKRALEMLRTAKFDLVITDMSMPVMDGYDLIKQMHNARMDIPVIIITASDKDDVEGRLSGISVHKLLEKPLDYPDMAKMILTM